ncbi:MAG: helix-turn-helix domain-containing protein [Dokdonella sp.]
MQAEHDSQTTVFEHDSALGCWSVAMRRVHPALRGIVCQLWHGAGRVAYQRDRILPRAQSYLLINLGPPQYMVLAGTPEIRVVFDDIWYSGISEVPIDCEAPHGNVLLGVAFSATGAAALLPQSQSALANRTGSFADLFGVGALALRERLLETPDAVRRLAVVEQWLLDICVSGRHVHPLVDWAVRRIAASGGHVRTAQLASDAGISRKHLAGLFRDKVGLTPKSIARIHRFQRALDAVQVNRTVDWSELADRCGYYDQSHLIHDFQQFAGMSPGEFARQAQPDLGSVVLR